MHSCTPLDSISLRNLPAKQLTHVVRELAPDCCEYVPCIQEIQLVSEIAGSVVEYFP